MAVLTAATAGPALNALKDDLTQALADPAVHAPAAFGVMVDQAKGALA